MTEVTPNRSAQHVAIYFNAGSSEIMKTLAQKIRAKQGKTTLIWSDRWNGPENLLMEVRAVIIEIDCANHEEIRESYLKFGQDVEVHYVDHDGVFVDNPEPEKEADDTVKTEPETGESEAGSGEDGPDDIPPVPEPATDVPEAAPVAESDSADPVIPSTGAGGTDDTEGAGNQEGATGDRLED